LLEKRIDKMQTKTRFLILLVINFTSIIEKTVFQRQLPLPTPIISSPALQITAMSLAICIIDALISAFALFCTRYILDHSGLTSIATAESWYPETLNIQDKDFKDIEGQKSLRAIRVSRMRTGNEHAEMHIVYQLLPSRKFLASLRQLGGFQLPGDARYNCNKTPEQVK
jgi:hypothetical protein